MYRTPGVYLQETPQAEPAPTIVSFGVAGLVGQAMRGPVNRPQRITSWDQFTAVFGSFIGSSYLAHSVYAFFQNGGRVCYPVRVAGPKASVANARLYLPVGEGKYHGIGLQAASVGAWGNELHLTLRSDSLVFMGHLETDLGSPDQPISYATHSGLLEGANHPSEGPKPELNLHFPSRRDEPGQLGRSGDPVFAEGFSLTISLGSGSDRIEEHFERLSVDPNHERYFPAVINGSGETDEAIRQEKGYSLLVRVSDNGPQRVAAGQPARVELSGGVDDGEPLGVGDYTGYGGKPGTPLHALSNHHQNGGYNGLACLEEVWEVEVVAIPDLALIDLREVLPPDRINSRGLVYDTTLLPRMPYKALHEGQQHLIHHCLQVANRFALLDAPRPGGRDKGLTRLIDWSRSLQRIGASFSGLYFPWIELKMPGSERAKPQIPPSGFMAGVFKRASEQGLGHSPANYRLESVWCPETEITAAEQEELNQHGVNCLRLFPGRGIRVWGARTLQHNSYWRYISVRLLVMRIFRFIEDALRETVFEPNDPDLWHRITATLSLFLRDLFYAGDLGGRTEQEAFFVKCDGETNTPETIDQGRVLALLGFQATLPAEFIVVRINRASDAATSFEISS